MIVALIPTSAAILLTITVVVCLKKLTEAKNVMIVTKRESTRDKARADTAERMTNKVTGLAEDAIAQTGAALDVAKTIHEVNGKVDVLLGRDSAEAEQRPRGKHAASAPDAVVVPLEQRYIA